MTQSQQILCLLREGPKTLRQIAAHPSGVFYEFRSRVSELRHEGYVIVHHRYRHCTYCLERGCLDDCPARVAGQNIYKLEAEPARVEANGQLAFA